MKRMTLALLAVVVGAGSTPLAGQDVDWNERLQRLSLMQGEVQEYRLGEGDLLEISFFGVENLSRVVRISGAGEISLPFLGGVPAAGLTVGELEELLKAKMLEADLIRDPQVTVFIKEYHSQPVFVLGAVNRPGQYEMTRPLRLIDVLAMAGGLQLEKASHYALVQPAAAGEGGAQAGTDAIFQIDLKRLLEEGDLTLNLPLEGGAVVHVPERRLQYFYVVGEVGRPGAFPLPLDRELMVSQALAQAGGPMRTAKVSKGIVVRYQESGARREIAVDFRKIITGKSPDFIVQPNDIIFVPGSTAKTIGYSLLDLIPNTLSDAVLVGPLGGR